MRARERSGGRDLDADVDASDGVILVRAVGLREAADIEQIGGFRLSPDAVGYEIGKWFATSIPDAERWGRAMQRFPNPRPFQIASVRIPVALARAFEFHERWDGIGPAFFVPVDQLSALGAVGSIQVFRDIFAPEDTA